MNHPPNFINRTGIKYGRLTAIEYAGTRKNDGRVLWRCKCDCGREIVAQGKLLGNGKTKSCGCIQDELRRSRFVDLTGKRFGRLAVIRMIGRSGKYRRTIWLCKCDCGNYSKPDGSSLSSGNSISCGCYASDVTSILSTVHGDTSNYKRTREYRSWRAMKDRCLRPKCKSYHNYGGRGIRICERWLNSYESFLEDMGRCPTGLMLERIHNDGNYEPSNCKWDTGRNQARNRRTNTVLTHKGKSMCAVKWAEELGISYCVILNRLKQGWSLGQIEIHYA